MEGKGGGDERNSLSTGRQLRGRGPAVPGGTQRKVRELTLVVKTKLRFGDSSQEVGRCGRKVVLESFPGMCIVFNKDREETKRTKKDRKPERQTDRGREIEYAAYFFMDSQFLLTPTTITKHVREYFCPNMSLKEHRLAGLAPHLRLGAERSEVASQFSCFYTVSETHCQDAPARPGEATSARVPQAHVQTSCARTQSRPRGRCKRLAPRCPGQEKLLPRHGRPWLSGFCGFSTWTHMGALLRRPREDALSHWETSLLQSLRGLFPVPLPLRSSPLCSKLK